MTYLFLVGKETNFQIVQSEKKKKKFEKFIASHLDVIVDDCIVLSASLYSLLPSRILVNWSFSSGFWPSLVTSPIVCNLGRN